MKPEHVGTGRVRVVIGGLLALAALLAVVVPSGSSGGDHARRVPDLQLAARTRAVHEQQRARVDADRVSVHRQRHAAAPEPAADPAVGEGARGPRALLYGGILVFATLGAYSLSASTVEVLVMYAIGVMGFFMRRYDLPIAPVMLGVILGPLMETQGRRALVGSGGDLGVFVSRPLTAALLLIAVAALLFPHVPGIMARLRGRDGGPGAFGAAEE
jgi:hypothetical protein